MSDDHKELVRDYYVLGEERAVFEAEDGGRIESERV